MNVKRGKKVRGTESKRGREERETVQFMALSVTVVLYWQLDLMGAKEGEHGGLGANNTSL